MRLTLRTMLAYMDEILEPDDAEDIGKKIHESEFATELLQKTRDCVSRVRLGAPPLAGRGIALDANTVAEYLDNTLAGERVPDFEKVCLESDMHLAEVAGCHQVLTVVVLGEAADVESLDRDRMYQLPASAAASPPVTAPPVGVRPPVPPIQAQVPPLIRRPKPEVPEYLRREPRSRIWTIAVAAFLIGIILGGGALLWLAPPEYRERFIAWFSPATNDDAPANDAEPENGSDESPSPEQETKSTTRIPTTEPTTSTEPPEAATGDDPTEDTDEMAGDGDAATDDVKTVATASEDPAVETTETESGEPAETAVERTTIPEVTEEPMVDVPPPVDGAGMGLGRYLSEQQDVLLRFDRAASTWRRLPTKSILAADDRLLSLPLFKSTIDLSAGVSIQLIGPTLIALGAPDRQGIPTITIECGRAHLLTMPKPQNKVWIGIGDRKGLLTFGNAESVVSFDVRWGVPAGQDPEATPAAVAAELYVTNGEIRWEEDETEESLKAPARFVIAKAAGLADADKSDVPKWINAEPSNLDKRAVTAVEKGLPNDRSVALGLKELSERRQIEVKSLAIRASAYIGQFEPVVAALNDPDQYPAWEAHVAALKAAVGRGPDVAAQVRATFEKQRGNDAKELYRMLWGYSAEDLKQGAAATLVDYLDNESLDFRVLSFNNLHRITGMGLPQDPQKRRGPHLQKWKERLKDGKIVPAERL